MLRKAPSRKGVLRPGSELAATDEKPILAVKTLCLPRGPRNAWRLVLGFSSDSRAAGDTAGPASFLRHIHPPGGAGVPVSRAESSRAPTAFPTDPEPRPPAPTTCSQRSRPHSRFRAHFLPLRSGPPADALPAPRTAKAASLQHAAPITSRPCPDHHPATGRGGQLPPPDKPLSSPRIPGRAGLGEKLRRCVGHGGDRGAQDVGAKPRVGHRTAAGPGGRGGRAHEPPAGSVGRGLPAGPAGAKVTSPGRAPGAGWEGRVREPEASPAAARRDPRLLVAQKSLLAPQHLPQLRRTPPPPGLGSWRLEAAGPRGHAAGAAAGGAAGTRLPRQPPLPAPGPRPAAPPGHSRASPFSRKDWFYSRRIELY